MAVFHIRQIVGLFLFIFNTLGLSDIVSFYFMCSYLQAPGSVRPVIVALFVFSSCGVVPITKVSRNIDMFGEMVSLLSDLISVI